MQEGEPIKKEDRNEIKNDENLLKEYVYFVKFIARRMSKKLPPNVEEKDLINAGIHGLYDAMQKYDPSKNTSLKTYAEFRIRGSMLDFLRSQDTVSRRRRKQEKLGEIEPLKFVSLGEISENELPHDREGNDPFINAGAKESAEKISRAAEGLSPRENTIINLYYYKGLTLKEIGLKLGISEGRVSQIHSKALEKLKEELKDFKDQLY